MLDLFAKATKDALSLLGEGSFLRGEPCQVHIEHGVELAGMNTDYETAREARNIVYTRSVAQIDATAAPKTGDLLVHPDGQFKLDVKLEDSGAFSRWALVKA